MNYERGWDGDDVEEGCDERSEQPGLDAHESVMLVHYISPWLVHKRMILQLKYCTAQL